MLKQGTLLDIIITAVGIAGSDRVYGGKGHIQILLQRKKNPRNLNDELMIIWPHVRQGSSVEEFDLAVMTSLSL